MIHKVDDGGQELAHVGFQIIRLLPQHGRLVAQVGGDDPVEVAFLVSLVESCKTVCKKAEGTADEHSFGVHFLKLSGGINHAAAGGDHVVYDDGVLAVDIIPQKLMGYDGILAVYDGRVIPSFIEHTGIYAQHVGEVNAAVQSALIRTDDNGVFLVDDKIPFRAQQRLDKLVGRREVVKALDGNGVLHSGVGGVEGDEIGDAHIHDLLDGVSAVQRFPAASFMLSALVEKRHDHRQAVCLAVDGGDDPF